MKPWQKGYDLDKLKDLEKLFGSHSWWMSSPTSR